ncbi:MAG: SigB/SigF/SigG family RNA polymerase sigma factor [Eubacterium sp.]|nr:SigB/SigF/SigG family RNA polymerase sigma factor [uncultured Anaerobutyricum sp.]MBN2926452.1 SigB/SigF/SigG family RNA polymerase sigma factor [Eubacterium sp.]
MERTCELIRQAKEGNKKAQEILVEENTGLIWSVVKRFQGRGYDKEDLFQIGSIGLLKCIDNFDLERKVKFSTYAVPLIMGEIKRFLRDDGLVKVSRSLKEASYKIKREKEHYEKLYNREPTLKEIAATLDMDESDILMAMESGQDVCSLHQIIYQNEGDEIHLEDKLEQQSDLIEQTVDNIYIQELLQKLNEQERKLIELRYFQNQTQAVIAGIMGISQVQVSRMEKKILEKLRMHSLN